MVDIDYGYSRITINAFGIRHYWARNVEVQGKNTLFVKVDKDGNDSSYYDKVGNLIIPTQIIASVNIIKKEPAIFDKTYGTLRVAGQQELGL